MKSVSKLLFGSLLAMALTGCVGGYYEYSYDVGVHHDDLGSGGHWGGGHHH